MLSRISLVIATIAVLMCSVALGQSYSGTVVLTGTSLATVLSTASSITTMDSSLSSDLTVKLLAACTVSTPTGSSTSWTFPFTCTTVPSATAVASATSTSTWLIFTQTSYTVLTGAGLLSVSSVSGSSGVVTPVPGPARTTYTGTLVLTGTAFTSTFLSSTTNYASFLSAVQSDLYSYFSIVVSTFSVTTVTTATGSATVSFTATVVVGATVNGATFSTLIAAFPTYVSTYGGLSSTNFQYKTLGGTDTLKVSSISANSGSKITYAIAVLVALVAAIVA